MKVSGIPISPPAGMENGYKVTPELLAACLAKYSRSNEGIDKILEKVDWEDPYGAVDRIFKFIDYGHASIGGLTGGIAICVDDVSMFMAYKIFEIAQLCDGQESSTRYITLTPEGLPDPKDLGIPEEHCEEWTNVMTECFNVYEDLSNDLKQKAKDDPSIMNIPKDVTDKKVIARMRKNYALDRARYFIPLATKTSAAYVMTARVWADTIKRLESVPLKEAKDVATLLRTELEKFAPRLIRHSHADECSEHKAFEHVASGVWSRYHDFPIYQCESTCEVELNVPQNNKAFTPEGCFMHKKNRYSEVGSPIKRTFIRANWSAISFAELRDLNRHRTGFRYTNLIPKGFYLPDCVDREPYTEVLKRVGDITKKLADSDDMKTMNYIYCYLLGTQVEFEHSTQLDKFIYEIELRTGRGSHFKYAEHLTEAYDDLIKKAPELEPYIELGTAEPE
tara:strand:+ start:40926 stop:42275 length:1350 start_codon:yes stop_codon:yes gene_type:complete